MASWKCFKQRRRKSLQSDSNKLPTWSLSLTGLRQTALLLHLISAPVSLCISLLLPLTLSDFISPSYSPLLLPFPPNILFPFPLPSTPSQFLLLSIPPSFSPPLSDTLSNLSTCFLSPPETWYKVRGEQRDRSDDPRESLLLMHEHKQQLYTDYISKMYCVVGPLQNLHFQ